MTRNTRGTSFADEAAVYFSILHFSILGWTQLDSQDLGVSMTLLTVGPSAWDALENVRKSIDWGAVGQVVWAVAFWAKIIGEAYVKHLYKPGHLPVCKPDVKVAQRLFER